MAFTETAGDFIDSDDFAISATLQGSAVTVIIDAGAVGEEYALQPIALGSYADLGAAVAGNTLIAGGVTYTVAEPPENDSSQVTTTLVLKRA